MWFSRWSRKRPVFWPWTRSTAKRTPPSSTSTVSGHLAVQDAHRLLEALEPADLRVVALQDPGGCKSSSSALTISPFARSVPCDSVWITR